MTLIGVKSKYGSCNGNCTGWIIINKNKNFICFLILNKVNRNILIWFKSKKRFKEGSIIGKMGWAVNSIAICL